MQISTIVHDMRQIFVDKTIITETKITKNEETNTVCKIEVIHSVLYKNDGNTHHYPSKELGNNLDVMI